MCANCSEEHAATSRECKVYQQQKNILKIKIEKKCSLRQAQNFYKNQMSTPALTNTFASVVADTQSNDKKGQEKNDSTQNNIKSKEKDQQKNIQSTSKESRDRKNIEKTISSTENDNFTPTTPTTSSLVNALPLSRDVTNKNKTTNYEDFNLSPTTPITFTSNDDTLTNCNLNLLQRNMKKNKGISQFLSSSDDETDYNKMDL